MRAKDLAYEFERFGRLVRCDIPAPRNINARPYASSTDRTRLTIRFAFVEYEDSRDAEDAFHEMHNRRVGRDTFTVEWAKNTPSSSWRFEGGRDRPNRDADRGMDRDRGDREYRSRDAPRRRSPIGDRAPRGETSPVRRDDRNGRRGRSYSRSPARTPPRRGGGDRDRSRSPRGSDRRDRDDRDDDRDDLRDVRNNGDDLDKYDEKDLVED